MDKQEAVKRYVVFVYDEYYPKGGWRDYAGSYDTLEEAQQAARIAREKGRYDYMVIIDLHTGENQDG